MGQPPVRSDRARKGSGQTPVPPDRARTGSDGPLSSPTLPCPILAPGRGNPYEVGWVMTHPTGGKGTVRRGPLQTLAQSYSPHAFPHMLTIFGPCYEDHDLRSNHF